MESVTVSSWNELVEYSFADSYNDRLQRFRSPFAFRGMVADWPLSNSLQRLRHDTQTLGFIERAMFRNFKKYAYAEVDSATSDWKWLSVAQHHGLPTRLLDWTFSPFVAMHFATNELDKMDKDGVLWMVNFDRLRRHLPSFFQDALTRHYALTFSVEMLEEEPALADPFVFEQTEGAQDAFAMFFEPPSLDPRIVNQWGLFSFTNRLDVRLDEWLVDKAKLDDQVARKIIIKADAKWEIRDKLDNMNLTERVMMPGLDGLSTWLKRWYSPKSAHPVAVTPGPQTASPTIAPELQPASKVGRKSGAMRTPSSKSSRAAKRPATRITEAKAVGDSRPKATGDSKLKPRSASKQKARNASKQKARTSTKPKSRLAANRPKPRR